MRDLGCETSVSNTDINFITAYLQGVKRNKLQKTQI